MNANIFSLLDSDDEAPKAAVPKKEVAAEKKPAAKEAPKTESRDAQRGGRGGRGGRGRGPRPNRDRFPRERDAAAAAAAPALEGEEKEKREPRHDGPRRERRGRDFDRHSGTGRGREVKKGGAGKANWGKDEEAPADENAAAATETPVENAEAEVVERVEEEEDTTMTLQEYLAKKNQASLSGEAFEKRDLREVDEKAFAGAKKLTKDGKTPDFVEAQYERVNREKKSGRKKVLLEDVGFRAGGQEERRDSRGGRGGRGRGGDRPDRPDGGRGGRSFAGRGGRGPRPSKGAAATPNVADTNDFPALR